MRTQLSLEKTSVLKKQSTFERLKPREFVTRVGDGSKEIAEMNFSFQ